MDAELSDELMEALTGLEQRRERPGGYSSGYRCHGCLRFIGGPTVTCKHCGQLHGGVYHEAQATR